MELAKRARLTQAPQALEPPDWSSASGMTIPPETLPDLKSVVSRPRYAGLARPVPGRVPASVPQPAQPTSIALNKTAALMFILVPREKP